MVVDLDPEFGPRKLIPPGADAAFFDPGDCPPLIVVEKAPPKPPPVLYLSSLSAITDPFN